MPKDPASEKFEAENRINDLETKIAYQEHTIQELNDVIYQQQLRIDKVEIMCKHLMDRIQTMSESSGGEQPGNERPPHY